MNMPKSHSARYKKNKNTLLLIIGAIGVILFWRGVWALADITPVIANPWISLALGIVALVLSHQLYREL